MSKDKLIGIFVSTYVSKRTKKVTNLYVLDGTPEQHADYLSRVDNTFQHDGGFDDQKGTLPLLKGNPSFNASVKKGNIISIIFSEDATKGPRIDSTDFDTIKDECEMYNEPLRPALEKYFNSLQKYRASLKTDANKESVDLDLDGE